MSDVMKKLAAGLAPTADYDDEFMLGAIDARQNMNEEGLDLEMGLSSPDDAPLDPAASVNMDAQGLPAYIGSQDADAMMGPSELTEDDQRKQEIMSEVINTRIRSMTMQNQGAAETRVMAKKVSS